MDENFRKWATGYSGFDGGNPKGKIWLCGIEWGEESPKELEEIKKLFDEDVSKIENIIGYEHYSKNMEYNYNKRFMKVIAPLYNINIASDNDLESFNKDQMFFTKESNYLKLNLSPFNFPTTDKKHWSSEHEKLTGFPQKKDYEKWVWDERRTLFKDMTKKYNPRLIITTGASNKYFRKYKDFFGYKKEKFTSQPYTSDDRLKLRCFYDNENNRLIVNIYFFSRGWLVSDDALEETGRIIKKLLKYHKINIKSEGE